MLNNFDNIQIPETVRRMPDIDPKVRHFRKWAILIGIPLIAIFIIVGVYFVNLKPRQSASQQINSPSTGTSQNSVNPSATGLLPSDNLAALPGSQTALSSYKINFESIKLSLTKYDEIFKDVKFTGQCYSTLAGGVAAQDAWVSQLNSQLGQNIPEIYTEPNASNTALTIKYNQLKSEYKNFILEVKVFKDSQQKIYQAWLDTNKTIFKVCDSSVEQVVESCKPVGTSINNYKSLLIKENNQDLFSNLDAVNSYCSQIAQVIKSDNIDKFNELNSSFGQNYQKTLSLYPNISDKTKTIKDQQIKISTLLSELTK